MPTPNDYSRVNFSNSLAPAEYGQVNPADTDGPISSDLVPTEGPPKQLQVSSDVPFDQRDLAKETDASISAFADLQNFLMNNLETPGSRVCNPQSRPYRPPHGHEGE